MSGGFQFSSDINAQFHILRPTIPRHPSRHPGSLPPYSRRLRKDPETSETSDRTGLTNPSISIQFNQPGIQISIKMPPNNSEHLGYLEIPFLNYSHSQTSSPTSCSSSSDPSSYPHHLLDLQSSFFHHESTNPHPNTEISFSHPSVYNYAYPTMPLPPPSPPSTTEITRHLSTLRGHLVNTLTGLRYIEKQLIPLSSHPSHPTVVQEMTNAWSHYVDTNFLNELRRLTKQYPFSEELFRDAKERVRGGGYRSWNSWNMAWVMLRVMEEE